MIDLSLTVEDYMPAHKLFQRPVQTMHMSHEGSRSLKLRDPFSLAAPVPDLPGAARRVVWSATLGCASPAPEVVAIAAKAAARLLRDHIQAPCAARDDAAVL